MLNRTAIMRRAWQSYRYNQRSGRPFDRKAFAACLSAAWAEAKFKREHAAEVAGLAAPVVHYRAPRFVEDLPSFGFLATRYSMSANEAYIRSNCNR